jgi:hypothetical protein
MTVVQQPLEARAGQAGPLMCAVDSTIYVDQSFVFESRGRLAKQAGKPDGHRWCHMWSADLQALHTMAEKIGMRREWFQDRPGFPHYDLLPTRRAAALKLGAIERSLRDWLRAQRAQKSPLNKSKPKILL